MQVIFCKKAAPKTGTAEATKLAAEAAQLAENLPDGAAAGIGAAAGEVEHLADLLIRILSREDGYDCNRFVTIYQAVNTGSAGTVFIYTGSWV